MTILVRAMHPSELIIVHDLLANNGWQHRVKSLDWLKQLIDNSSAALVAVSENQLIGFVRAISDGMSNGYISMLVVDPDYRRQGIARALVQTLINGNSPEVTWVLRAGRNGATEFFIANGFEQSTLAMEFKRPRS